jgi:hypothetical protein
MKRGIGLALLVLLAIHANVRPERGWVLVSACDLAAIATAIGLIAGWHRWVAIAFVFQLAIGLPALAIGLFTTYEPNPTGIAIHVVPLVLGGLEVRRRGLPRRSALLAWLGYAGAIALAAALAPAALNLNFAARVWPPLAGTFTLPMFQLAILAVGGVMLAATELAVRALLGRGTPRQEAVA